ncbi:glycoside hydrolase [Sphingomonas sp. Leaf208]|uniref:glycoside hydrolase family 43 protein n=1 Tax=Sphingomonas sp. Leaf208 TaxID=1735679 RepID=UPI0007015B0D|nr:glycoside hydrolase 43 family protein [Sphingomonas sp. Leaf208]KQM51889.1 glycoside hydrolase [Sphingomonas sp. Leaf208]
MCTFKTALKIAAAAISVSGAIASAQKHVGVAVLERNYTNPVLHGDYSDPDVTRVGDDYYMTSSSFSNVPGLPVLHSRDLVNWSLIGHALKAITPTAHFATPRRTGGVFAPSIRHHDGKFVIYYPDPDQGIFLVTATDPHGPWSDPVLAWKGQGMIDPAPFWDEDGTGWLVVGWAKSRAGINNLVTLKRLNRDGAVAEPSGRGKILIDGASLPPVATSIGPRAWSVIEGPKLYKRNGWYYIFVPAGGVKQGWQGVFRARSITGPYEGRNVLDQGRTPINGPHQGAWVNTAQGEDWFIHFQDRDAFGRQVLLQPMKWLKNGWPVIGIDPDGDGRGEPVVQYRKPALPSQPATPLNSRDDFDHGLSLAWQWNANPRVDWASLIDNPGSLRLKSVSSTSNLYETGNVLSQKLPAMSFITTTKLVFSPKNIGEAAGLVLLGQDYGWVGVKNIEAGLRIVQVANNRIMTGGVEREIAAIPARPGPVWLRLSVIPREAPVEPQSNQGWPSMRSDLRAKVIASFSVDGERFKQIGEAFEVRQGGWVGAQVGVFARATSGTPAFVAPTVGYADFDDFTNETRP